MNFDELMGKIASEPLSKTLPIVLRFAISIKEPALAKWVKLELNGYFNTNPELTEEVVVPVYRTVAGFHSDDFGRQLEIDNAELAFVNTNRLRFGVADLEKLANEKQNARYSYRDPNMSAIIKRNMNVDVSTYTFYTNQLAGVLSGIQTELIERLIPFKERFKVSIERGNPSQIDDIVELKPNFFGLGLNLNALMRKWKNYKSKKR